MTRDPIELTPGGAQTISKMRWNFPDNWPLVLVGANGATVTSAEREGLRTYVDWTMGLASVGIGYADPRVANAVHEAMKLGPSLPLASYLEGSLAEKYIDAIPCAEMVRFMKTGSEAAEAAIRVARMATGRDVIVSAGYHSWHSWYAASRPEHPGVPPSMERLVRPFVYNDVRSLDLAISLAQADYVEPEIRRGVAAIFLEPTLVDEPSPGFLEACRERADELRCPLIFDEVVTGFRWTIGGYQAVCGVTPDLATFGKAAANGVPFAALVGKRSLMDHAWVASGTFNGDLIGLAAASEVLRIYEREDICARIRHAGERFLELAAMAQRDVGEVHCHVTGQPQHPRIVFADDKDRRKMTHFLRVLCDNGVLLHPGGFNPSAAHGEAEQARTAFAIRAALTSVRQAVETGLLNELEPEPIGASWRMA